MEICLSIFAEDQQWYRAMCIDAQNNTCLVLFLDYGNLSSVSKKDIMPMIPELMFPSNANMVYVDGEYYRLLMWKVSPNTYVNLIYLPF